MRKNTILTTGMGVIVACAWITSASANTAEMKWVMQPQNSDTKSNSVCELTSDSDKGAEMIFRPGADGRPPRFLQISHTEGQQFNLRVLNATELLFSMKDEEGVIAETGSGGHAAEIPLHQAFLDVFYAGTTKTGAFADGFDLYLANAGTLNFDVLGRMDLTAPELTDIESSADIIMSVIFAVDDPKFLLDPTKTYTATMVATCTV